MTSIAGLDEDSKKVVRQMYWATAALAFMVGVMAGLFIGIDLGKDREHDFICNSPQPPYAAPVAIPACDVDPR